MYVLALTGGIACGKSTVAAWFKELGAAVIDADEISRELTGVRGVALADIFDSFGASVQNPDGTLNRAALAQAVFSGEAPRRQLDGILHPRIRVRIQQALENCRKSGISIVVLEAPLLYEAGMADLADAVVCVAAPPETQISRLKARNGLSREQALARMASQWPLEKKIALADEALWTNQPASEVRARVEAIFQRLQERSRL